MSIDVFPDGAKAGKDFKRKDKTGEKENLFDESYVVSACRDGIVNLWKISAKNEDQILEFVSTVTVVEPITRVKFIQNDRIVISTTHGTIWSTLLLKDG